MSGVTVPTKRDNAGATKQSGSARSSRPALKQPTFNWKAQNKYDTLLNFEMEEKKCSLLRVMISMSLNNYELVRMGRTPFCTNFN